MNLKRITAVLVLLCMVVCMLPPTQTNAAEERDYTYTVSGGNATITGYTGAGGNITIPDTLGGYPVTSIGDGAFIYCARLTSVIIPNSMIYVGINAFYGCTSLTYNIYDNGKYLGSQTNPYVVLVDTVSTNITSCKIHTDTKFIGGSAFEYCRNLTSIEIPNSVTNIGNSAFNYCSKLTSVEIPDSVTRIGDSAFSYCSNLISIEIPDSVTRIGDSVFHSCTNLTSIWVNENNPNYSSDMQGVLFDKDKIELIQAPSALSGAYIIPDSVTTIGDYAFSNCNGLTVVEIPESVTTIGHYAFYYCTNLSYNTYDNANYLGNENNPYLALIATKFQGITSCQIHEATKVISDTAFGGNALVSIEIPDGVTSIGNSVFSDCSSLISIVIPDSVTVIRSHAFYCCNRLTKVIYCGTEEQWNIIDIEEENTVLTNAIRQYHDYVDGACSICGHTTGQAEHLHTWENGVCTGCGQELSTVIDLSGDGKISAFDAQLLAEAKAGLRQLTDEQWEALGHLTVSDIIDYILGRFPGMATEE